MKHKLLSTLLISASVLASGPVFAHDSEEPGDLGWATPASVAAPAAATPASKKVKKAKKAKAAPAATAKGSQAQLVPNVLPVKNTDAAATPAPATK